MGLVPVVGVIPDLLYQANMKNVRLLQRGLRAQAPRRVGP